MRRRRNRQLTLTFGGERASWLPKDKQDEVVDALAELLLGAAVADESDEGSEDDECQDHR
jgi:hypothetical protein